VNKGDRDLKMVQGLGFLSKKSWHTKNKANQEKVWIAEQKKEQETAKAKELAREIQEEREVGIVAFLFLIVVFAKGIN